MRVTGKMSEAGGKYIYNRFKSLDYSHEIPVFIDWEKQKEGIKKAYRNLAREVFTEMRDTTPQDTETDDE